MRKLRRGKDTPAASHSTQETGPAHLSPAEVPHTPSILLPEQGVVHIDTMDSILSAHNISQSSLSKPEKERTSLWRTNMTRAESLPGESCSLLLLRPILFTVITKLDLSCADSRGGHAQTTSWPLLRSLPQITLAREQISTSQVIY